MFMFGIVRVLASWRFPPILFEAGVFDLLQPDARSVEADDCILAYELEEVAPVLLSRAMAIFISQVGQPFGLPLGRDFQKPASEQVTGVRVNPPDSIAEAVLQTRIAVDDEINELADALLPRSGRAVSGNDHLGEPRNDLVLLAGEKLRFV